MEMIKSAHSSQNSSESDNNQIVDKQIEQNLPDINFDIVEQKNFTFDYKGLIQPRERMIQTNQQFARSKSNFMQLNGCKGNPKDQYK